MYSFVAADGKILWSQPFGSQWEHYWAPLVVGGRVYFDGGGYGGLYGLDQASGTQLFFASEAQWDEWSPLYLDNYAYVFTDGNLHMHDPASGTVVRSAMVAWIWNGYSMNTSPVSDGSSIYIISPPNLITPGGWLSIARGQLLVAAQDGTLVAWSLAQ
jgi:hypothetical protein